MGQNDKYHFIIVDDSKLDCFIAERIIRNTGKGLSVTSFIYPSDALEHLANTPAQDPYPNIILVDIQMPVMNGFQFVEEFEKLPPSVVENYIVFVISSSINDEDMLNVDRYKSIRQFINKPLTAAMLGKLLLEEY